MNSITLEELKEMDLPLDAEGKIIDFLDSEKRRPNTPEERNRQLFALVLVNEYSYDKEEIAFEVPIQIGRDDKKRADIVVFRNVEACKRRDLNLVRLIIEVKAPDILSGERQLFSYLFATSAEGGVWFNGEVKYYRKNAESTVLDKYPGIPIKGQAWETIGAYKKKDLIRPFNLKPVLRKCHNSIYRFGINSEDVAMDMVRILLAKFTDETNPGNECEFRCTPEELTSEAGKKEVAKRVRILFEQVKSETPDVFGVSEEITSGDDEIASVVTQLQQYSFLEAPYDVIGMAYETYVASHLKGERGQYFTNRLVVDLMVKMIDPSENDIILDPACGSGGFLLRSLSYVSDKIRKSKRNEAAIQRAESIFKNRLFGIDKTPKLVKVAKANMLLSKDGHTGLIHHDSLKSFDTLPHDFSLKAGKELPTVILTNPPFGASIEHKITDVQYLSQYQSTRNWIISDKSDVLFEDEFVSGVAPELLFLEKCIHWATPGGYIGIVMARGALDNKESTPYRKFIIENTQIVAIVNCHNDTFEPYCGSKASFLILRKKKNDERTANQDYPIFMAISKKIGQTSRGEPIFKRNQNGEILVENNYPVLDHDMDDILTAFNNWKQGKPMTYEFTFSINFSQIERPYYNLNPVRFIPTLNHSVKKVIEIGEQEGWEIRRLGDIATVFNGPRFKRPYADDGIKSGPGIVPYFTGTAFTQTKGDNIKYLDRNKATEIQNRQLDQLTIHEGWILITDSGTLGRVIYARSEHDGIVATNNLIRVVIEDENLRGYVYQFLMGELGQNQMLRYAYGTNQEHIEPWHVEELLIPFPSDLKIVEAIGQEALESIKLLDESRKLERHVKECMKQILISATTPCV